MGRGSWDVDRGSWIVGRGLWVVRRASWVVHNRGSILITNSIYIFFMLL